MTPEVDMASESLAQALALVAKDEETKKDRDAFIARLRQEREDIDKALVALGAKRQRRTNAAKPKRGRPAGSKNQAKVVEVAA